MIVGSTLAGQLQGLAVERIRAARRAIDETGVPVVLTARCEAWLGAASFAELNDVFREGASGRAR